VLVVKKPDSKVVIRVHDLDEKTFSPVTGENVHLLCGAKIIIYPAGVKTYIL
jgi:hypothetical protein